MTYVTVNPWLYDGTSKPIHRDVVNFITAVEILDRVFYRKPSTRLRNVQEVRIWLSTSVQEHNGTQLLSKITKIITVVVENVVIGICYSNVQPI